MVDFGLETRLVIGLILFFVGLGSMTFFLLYGGIIFATGIALLIHVFLGITPNN